MYFSPYVQAVQEADTPYFKGRNFFFWDCVNDSIFLKRAVENKYGDKFANDKSKNNSSILTPTLLSETVGAWNS